MSRTHHIICILLAVLMISLLTACGQKADTQTTPAEATTAAGQAGTQADDGPQNAENAETTAAPAAEPAKLSGKLNIIGLEDRDPSVLRGVRITGNRIGSEEDINGKASSLDDVRCIFELNEWVGFCPDADAGAALQVWAFRHRDDQEFYNTCEFSDLTPGFAGFCELAMNEEDPDSTWGEFYLNPDDCEPGYYDLVFTSDGKAIATLLTRFYNSDELTGKTGAELEALMHE